jgi:hypothetical protein
MLALLWTLLNTALLLVFIFLCINATKLLRNKYGIFASVLFAFVLLSFVGRPGKSEPIKKWQFIPENQTNRLTEKHLWVNLEETISAKYELGIRYRQDEKTLQILPTEAFTKATGWLGGTYWVPDHVSVHVTKPNTEFRYVVKGKLKWNLLSVIIYVQTKTYQGLVKIPK